MASIEKGSDAARATYRLFEAWTGEDGSEVEATFEGAMAFANEIVFNLILIVGGALQTLATLAGRSFEDVRADVWQQLAVRGKDDHAAQVMRTAVTAWTSGSVEDAHYVNESGILAEVEPPVLMMHFVGVWTMLARRLTEHYGEPFDNALEGLRDVLGIERSR